MAQSVVGGDYFEVLPGTTGGLTWPDTNSGDIAYVMAAYYWLGTGTLGTPSGFTSAVAESPIDGSGGGSGTSNARAFYKVCDGTESGDLTITWSASVNGAALLVVLRGDGALSHASINTINVDTAGIPYSATATSVSGTAGQILLALYGVRDTPGADIATPSGMTLAQGDGGAATGINVRSYWQAISSTGATGDKTWEYTNNRGAGSWLVLIDDTGGASAPKRSLLLGIG